MALYNHLIWESQVKSILEKLEFNAKQFASKIIFSDVNNAISYADFTTKAKFIAQSLNKHNIKNKLILA